MKILKRTVVFLALILAFGTITAFAENASAKAHITKMMSLIDKQNFANTQGVEYIKEKINYLMYDSQFAATKNSYFGYPNKPGYPGYSGEGYSSVVDNGNRVYLRGSTWGCMTYARYVNTIVNGSDPSSYKFLEQKPGYVTGEGLKEFLLTYGQAGEHLRIDTTHSVAFIAGDNEGFYYFNYNYD
ncbi:MAG: hypothetical protein IKY12_00490, partial [Clostridia bacterium]|nr:hypothetical protein [Clostridia bacterium]